MTVGGALGMIARRGGPVKRNVGRDGRRRPDGDRASGAPRGGSGGARQTRRSASVQDLARIFRPEAHGVHRPSRHRLHSIRRSHPQIEHFIPATSSPASRLEPAFSNFKKQVQEACPELPVGERPPIAFASHGFRHDGGRASVDRVASPPL
jgi:hypothetical protein